MSTAHTEQDFCPGHMSGCHVRDGSGICPLCKQRVDTPEQRLQAEAERDTQRAIALGKTWDSFLGQLFGGKR